MSPSTQLPRPAVSWDVHSSAGQPVNLYVSVDAADSSDMELLASVTTAQSTGDDESPSDDNSTTDNAEDRRHR